jgi:hypothetical protein
MLSSAISFLKPVALTLKRLIKPFLLFFFIIHLSAFTNPPKEGDTIELSTWLNLRSSAQFRQSDNNRIRVLAPKTKLQVLQVKKLPSGNFALKVNTGLENESASWIYFNAANPSVSVYNQNNQPVYLEGIVTARRAITNRQVSAIIDADDGNQNAELVQKIEEGNVVARLLNPNPVCKGCTENKASRFRCEPSNAEKDLVSNIENQRPDSLISQILKQGDQFTSNNFKKCVSTSIKNAPGRFVYCNGQNQKVALESRSCVQPVLESLSANSLGIATDCLADYYGKNMPVSNTNLKKQFQEKMLRLLNFESGFHPNAMSPSSAGGVGQLTGVAIREINKSELGNIKNFINSQQKPSCKIISQAQLKPMSDAKSNFCDRVSADNENPLKNLIYTIAYQKLAQQEVTKILRARPEALALIESWPKEKQSEFIMNLSSWAHNAGPGGLGVTLLKYLSTANAKELLKQGDTNHIYSNLKYMMYANHVNYFKTSNARATEASSFHENIIAKYENLKNKTGLSNRNQTCSD